MVAFNLVFSPICLRTPNPRKLFEKGLHMIGQLSWKEWVLLTVIPIAVVMASIFKLWPVDTVEALGFATGGACVWLVVREHTLNFPIGLANNVFFVVLFWNARLYADVGLQVVFFALGVFGWWNWCFGGKDKGELVVTKTNKTEWVIILFFVVLGVWGLRQLLILVNGAAPFWDAMTTILSLVAQYLLCQKRYENWFFWITVDLICVPLYISRGLPLTAFLYGTFLILCLMGLWQWSRSLKQGRDVVCATA